MFLTFIAYLGKIKFMVAHVLVTEVTFCVIPSNKYSDWSSIDLDLQFGRLLAFSKVFYIGTHQKNVRQMKTDFKWSG